MIRWNSYSAERFLKFEQLSGTESERMTRRQAKDQGIRP